MHPAINLRVQLAFIAIAATCCQARAQMPVTPSRDHALLLASDDARLARNKRQVYDFWREVIEAGHLDLAGKYLTESYIQHNPGVPTGRDAFVDFFSRFTKVQPIGAAVAAPLVAIVAEGDLVVLSFVREVTDPKDRARKYTTTSFDMFRIENGKIAEHWDAMVRP